MQNINNLLKNPLSEKLSSELCRQLTRDINDTIDNGLYWKTRFQLFDQLYHPLRNQLDKIEYEKYKKKIKLRFG